MFCRFVGHKTNGMIKTDSFGFLITFNIKEITDKTHSNKKKQMHQPVEKPDDT